MLPLVFQLRGVPVLVVGAGRVGRRKADVFRAAGAIVTLVDPILPESHAFTVADLAGVRMVVACATDAANAGVVAACRERGMWVCDAIRPERGDFILPAVLERGGLQIAVSTGGAGPGLAKAIRDELAAKYDDSYAEWVRILGIVRGEALDRVADAEQRRRLFAEFCQPRWRALIASAGADAALARMRARF